MNSKKWALWWLGAVILILALPGIFVIYTDPFFHFHKPHTDTFFYTLDNQRSQNNGITKNFDYDAILTGTSMISNFKTTELDALFGVSSVKLPYSGGSYREINDNLVIALREHPEIRCIFRGLDTGKFFEAPDYLRTDLGSFPTYLYDDNPFNDVNYLFNRDVLFNRVFKMMAERKEKDFEPGITSFDAYDRWQHRQVFGRKRLLPEALTFKDAADAVHLSNAEKETMRQLIQKNVTSLADANPNVDFYYFFTPYSILWYKPQVEDGTVYRQLEAERFIIEEILKHENIKLFSFNDNAEIITDLNNYKDEYHYAAWINSYMLKEMKKNNCLLTEENYEAYLEKEYNLFLNFDYLSLNDQEDYEDDWEAAKKFQ